MAGDIVTQLGNAEIKHLDPHAGNRGMDDAVFRLDVTMNALCRMRLNPSAETDGVIDPCCLIIPAQTFALNHLSPGIASHRRSLRNRNRVPQLHYRRLRG